MALTASRRGRVAQAHGFVTAVQTAKPCGVSGARQDRSGGVQGTRRAELGRLLGRRRSRRQIDIVHDGGAAQADETVVFSWLTWPSRSARDAGMKKARADSRLTDLAMPFDGQRMIYGGFKMILEAQADKPADLALGTCLAEARFMRSTVWHRHSKDTPRCHTPPTPRG